jgi:hypothetical protein
MTVSREPAEGRPVHRHTSPQRLSAANLALLGLALVYGVIGFTRAVDAFWSPNQGSKLLQVQALLDGRWDLSIAYAGQSLDPTLQFRPYVYSYLRDGGIQVPWSIAWALPSAVMYQMLGSAGLVLLPVAAGLLAAWAAGRLAEWLLPGTAATAVLVAGLATPLFVYSTLFWEHAPAAGAYALGLCLLLAPSSYSPPVRLVAAGVSFGLAVALRNEALLFVLPVLASVLAAGRLPSAGPTLVRLAAGMLLVLAPLAIYNWQVLGGLSAQRMLPLVDAPAAAASNVARYLVSLPADLLVGRQETGPSLPEPVRWAPLVAILLLLSSARQRTPARRRLRLLGLLLAGSSTAAMLAILPSSVATGFLLAAPFLVLIALEPFELLSRPPGRLLLLIMLAGLLLYTAVALPFHVSGVMGSGSQWGPRFLLPLFPPASALAAIVLHRLSGSGGRLELVLARALVLLGLLFQLVGLVQIEWQLEQIRSRSSALSALSAAPIVTQPGFLVDFGPGWLAHRPVFCVRTPAALGHWTALALLAGEREFWYADEQPLPSSWLREQLEPLERSVGDAGIPIAYRYATLAVRAALQPAGSPFDACAQQLRG